MATGLQCLYYVDFETKFEEEEAHLAFLQHIWDIKTSLFY